MLVIVRHRGELDVTKLPKWLASRQVGMDSGEYETLVDARLEDVSVLEGMAGVLEVAAAQVLQDAFMVVDFDLRTPEDAPPESPRRADALGAVEELRDWLDLTYEDLSVITGIATNTFYHWRRTGAKPRPSTVRRLWRLHALVRALIAQLGQGQVAAWLHAGPHSPLDLLMNGDLEAAEEAAHVLLFRHPPTKVADQPDYAPFRAEPEFEVRAGDATILPRRALRRPTRGRFPG